jgi:Uma2 family endonuclease
VSIVLSDKIYTIEDYMKLDDGKRYELIGGELIVVPSPKPKHQKIANRFFAALDRFVLINNLGEVNGDVDVHLGDMVVAPDVFFIAKDRLNIIGELNIQGAPDLVVEILSPSTVVHDKKKKSQIYLEHGVKEYWLVDPDLQLVEVLIAGEKEWRWAGVFDQEDVLTTALLPGLELNLIEIFKGLTSSYG